MDIKETMIDFLLHKANDEQIEEFFGYAPHGEFLSGYQGLPKCHQRI